VDESMKKRQDTKLSKNKGNPECEMLVDDFLIYETMIRRRTI
jgi:hypothetical protein